MDDSIISNIPQVYPALEAICKKKGFTMPSDLYIGSLLKTLVASKPNGRFLELGTGASLSLAWMIDGMDTDSTLITIDNDPTLIAVANTYFGKDARVQIICEDGSNWLTHYSGAEFDIFNFALGK